MSPLLRPRERRLTDGRLAPQFPAVLIGPFLASALLATPPERQEPQFPAWARTTTAFVPTGYHVLKDLAGHLNGDENRDVVLLLGDVRESHDALIEDLAPRLLVVLAGDDSGFVFLFANPDAIMGKNDGGSFDPLESIELDRSVIVIRHMGGSAWRWAYTHRFRFQQGDFFLVGRTLRTFYNANYCRTIREFRPTTYEDQNLLTGARVGYRVPDDRCVKRRTRGKLPNERVMLRRFDVRRDVESQETR